MAYSHHGKPSVLTQHRDAGFTLLEVLIAFAIAAPALALLFREGVTSVSATKTAALYQEAISRAKSHLEMLADQGLIAGERSGDEGGGYHWRTSVVPVASAAARGPAPQGVYAAGFALCAVTVEVSWRTTSGSRAITLSTWRIGPASARGS